MRELRDRVAVVTGGASGIGRGMALAFADAGAHVAIADVEDEPARAVAREVESRGVRALALHVDVSDRTSVETLAEKVYGEFGAAHVLCNNAGVGAGGPLDQCTDHDWRWVLAVNLDGVVHGLQAFLPRMKRQDGEKHVVNTASMAGLIAFPGLGPYTASKYAVVGISETLRAEGASCGLGVSVLCAGLVRTNITSSQRNRPAALSRSRGRPEVLAEQATARMQKEGMDPLDVGRRVRAAVLENRLYVPDAPRPRALLRGTGRGDSQRLRSGARAAARIRALDRRARRAALEGRRACSTL